LVEDLTLELISRKMFWTNPKIKAIEMANMDNGEDRRTILQAKVNETEIVLDMPSVDSVVSVVLV
jgi:hypothetical protein